jgi:hypothetical protein
MYGSAVDRGAMLMQENEQLHVEVAMLRQEMQIMGTTMREELKQLRILAQARRDILEK